MWECRCSCAGRGGCDGGGSRFMAMVTVLNNRLILVCVDVVTVTTVARLEVIVIMKVATVMTIMYIVNDIIVYISHIRQDIC